MKQALILVDIQNDYFEGGKCELYEALETAGKTAEVLERFRKHDDLVIFIQHVNTREGAMFFVADTEGVKIHQSIVPKENERIIKKHAPNSFFETDLQNCLQENKITDLVICGMMSHMCIDTTVRAAKDLGYHVSVLENACTTKDLMWKNNRIPSDIVHNVIMASLQGMFGDVMTVEEYIKKT